MKNQSYKNLFQLIALVLAAVGVFTSCTRVLNIDLNTANSQIVIQGYVTDQPNVDTVKLVRTGSYYTAGPYPTINGATVIVSDNTGIVDTFNQVDSGTYVPHTTFVGVTGRTYTLTVWISGKEYDAVSTMPAAVNIDSIVEQSTTSFNGNTENQIRCFFRDPVGTGHYYMMDFVVNGILRDSLDNLNTESDKFISGEEINLRLRGYTPNPGDTVTANLMCIDAATYNYYSVLRSIASAGNPVSTAVPQNPPTNIIGGALGIFSAYPIRSKSYVVP